MRFRVLLACSAFALVPLASGSAQVGYPPDRSPFRDLPRGHVVTAHAGLFGGGGGRLGIGPQDGTLYGIRYDIRVGGPIHIGLAVSRGDLERLVAAEDDSVATRISGPFPQSMTMAEFGLQFSLTGPKTWHRLSPFIGAGIGYAFSGGTPQDTSAYRFGNKVYFVPSAGLKVYLTDRLHLRTEGRTVIWKLKYPTSFAEEPTLEPGNPPDDSNALLPDGKLDQWTASGWLQVGLGYSFTF